MNIRNVLAMLGVTAAMAGCASVPTGPSAMVLPGSGKTMEQFQAEDVRCRQAASGELDRTKAGQVSAQMRYDMAYMQCMYAAGNQIPMAGRPPGPGAANLPQPPAGTPPGPPPATSR